MDKFDDATKTLGYTVLEGDPRYSSFSAEMKFVPVGETSCEAIWTATYELVVRSIWAGLQWNNFCWACRELVVYQNSLRCDWWCAAVPHAGEVKERMDFFDDANKALGYTVLEGDPRYHYFSAVMNFVPGAAAGTTNAVWTATYVPVGDMGPPEHIKGIAILLFKALAGAAKAD